MSKQTHVKNCDFSFEKWDTLKSFYSLQCEIEIPNAMAQLSAIVQYKSEDLTIFVRRLPKIHGLLDRLGEPIPMTRQATNLLNSLNTKYSPMVKNIQTWGLTSPKLYNIPTIHCTFLQEDVREEINARKKGKPLIDHHGAHSANYSRSDRPYSKSGGASKRDDKKCYGCEKFGHLKRDCSQNREIRKCQNCGRPEHSKTLCRSEGGGDFGGGPDKASFESYT